MVEKGVVVEVSSGGVGLVIVSVVARECGGCISLM